MKQGANYSVSGSNNSFVANSFAFVAGQKHLSEASCSPRLHGPPRYVLLLRTSSVTDLSSAGSFIPAELALIGLTDKILTRVATRESISRVRRGSFLRYRRLSTHLVGIFGVHDRSPTNLVSRFSVKIDSAHTSPFPDSL